MKKLNRNDSKLLVTIEDIMSCPGRCPGCLTSLQDRRTRKPSMSDEIMNKTIESIKSFTKEEGNIDSLEASFVIGDHLYLDESYLESIYRRFNEAFVNLIPFRDSAFIFTAALYQKYDQIMPVLARHDERMNPDFLMRMNCIVDPLNKTHRPKLWEEQIRIIDGVNKNLRMETELSMNLSSQSALEMTPMEYYELGKSFGLEEVVVAWTPSKSNMLYTYRELEIIEAWISEFIDICSGDPTFTADFIITIENAIGTLDGKSVLEVIRNDIRHYRQRYLYIDSEGFILPTFHCVGDLAHHPSMGYQRNFHIEQHSLKEAIEGTDREVERSMLKSTTHKACRACPHRDYCSVSGYHVYSDFVRFNAQDDMLKQSPIHYDRCPHLGKTIFDKVLG